MAVRSRDLSVLARFFKVLGDETRMKILSELQGGPRNVTALVKKLRMPQPSVSHHLALLRGAEVVVTQRDGKSVIYSLNDQQLRNEKALRRMLGTSEALRIGKVLLGLAKR